MDENDTTNSAICRSAPSLVEETLCLAWVHPQIGVTPLDCDRLRLGRAADQTVRLAGEQVSRQHAEIARRGRRWLLVDQHSKNGCFQNGRRIVEAPSPIRTSCGSANGWLVATNERLRAQLLETLRATAGNMSLAAKKLHISRQRVYRLLAGRADVWAPPQQRSGIAGLKDDA